MTYYCGRIMSIATENSGAGAQGSFRSLRGNRDFTLLAGGQGLSWTGDAFQAIALSVAVITTGGTVGDLGFALASAVVARLLCTLVGGVWADRIRPQPIMITADLIRAAAIAGQVALFGTGHYSLPLLCLLTFVVGGAGAFFFPAMQSLKPTLVPPEQRQAANAVLSMLQTGASMIGPAVAGVVIAIFGSQVGFVLNAVTFLVSAATVAPIRAVAPRAHRVGFVHELRCGWSAVRERSWLLWGVVAAGVYHVANGVVLITVNVIALRDLGGPTALGFVSTAEGLGGVIGSAVALRARPRRPLVAGFLALGLMPVWVVSYVWPGVLTGVLLGALVGYSGLMFFSVCWETALQDNVPHHLLARVSSWDIVTSFIGLPIGQALAGPLGDRFGSHPVLVVCAFVILAAGVAPLLARGTRRLGRSGPEADDPHRTATLGT